MSGTVHTGAPLTDTAAWCEARQHPWVTYNPWLDRTWCRCGVRTAAGQQPMDWQAKHDQFHTCGDGPCSCYLRPAGADRPGHTATRKD